MQDNPDPSRIDGMQEIDAIGQLLSVLQTPLPDPARCHSAFISVPVEAEDAALSAVSEMYGSVASVLPTLQAWAAASHFQAVVSLAQVVSNMRDVTAGEALGYFEVVASLPEEFQYHCAMHLAEQMSPELAVVCGEALCTQTPFNEVQGLAWAIATTCNQPDSAILILERFTGPNVSLLKCMILDLSRVDRQMVRDAVHRRQQEYVELLLALANQPQRAQFAWALLARISDFCPLAQEVLCDAIAVGNVDAMHGRVSAYLAGNAIVQLATSEFLQLVQTLLAHAISDVKLLGKVDLMIALRMRSGIREDDGLAALTSFASVEGFDPIKRMSRCFDFLRSRPTLHGRLLTSWLLNAQIPHAIVRSALHDCSIGHVPQLDIALLAQAGEPGQRNVFRRLLALFHDGAALCAMAATFIESSELQPQGVSLGGDLLRSTWLEYAGEVEDFLNERLKVIGKRTNASRLYRELKAAADEWKRVLCSLPDAKELYVSAEKHRVLRSIEQRHSREIMRNAEKRSIFSSLFKSSHAAQGSRVAVEMADGRIQVSKLEQHSQRMALPSSELCDPLGGYIDRQRILREME